jgi:hypothetical protein
MKLIDFGSLESPPYNLFYPAFVSLGENFDKYYQAFLQRKGDEESANAEELRPRGEELPGPLL